VSVMDNLPALPLISQIITEYPDWIALFEALEGLDGEKLVSMGTLGKATMDHVNALDTRVKAHARGLPTLWAASLPGRMEQLGKDAASIRLAEEKRIKDFRAQVKRLNVEVDQARRHIAAFEKTRREQALYAEVEAELRSNLAAAKEAAENAANPDEKRDAEAQVAQIAAQPVITPTLSEKQVAKEIFDTPGVTAKVVYRRKVTDWYRFLRWLVEDSNPFSFITEQSDGSYRISFTGLKRSKLEIPGVECSEDTEISHR
jgi:hypothetical protein